MDLLHQILLLKEEKTILEQEIKNLKRQLSMQRENNHKRNLQLDALGMVWCTGGCPQGMYRYTNQQVTAELISKLIINAERAKSWYLNFHFKEENKNPEILNCTNHNEALNYLNAHLPEPYKISPRKESENV